MLVQNKILRPCAVSIKPPSLHALSGYLAISGVWTVSVFFGDIAADKVKHIVLALVVELSPPCDRLIVFIGYIVEVIFAAIDGSRREAAHAVYAQRPKQVAFWGHQKPFPADLLGADFAGCLVFMVVAY